MADLVLLHGSVWTGNPDLPRAEAVAILADRILAVGTERDVKALVGKKTRVVDLNGALVLPGFIDSHTHFLNGGFSLRSVQLRDATSREEFAARVAAKARELGKGAWVSTVNDHQGFDRPSSRPGMGRRGPPDNPVLSPAGGHMAWRTAGPAPPGSPDDPDDRAEIVRARDSEPRHPQGPAAGPSTVVPEPVRQEAPGSRIVAPACGRRGVTSVHEMATRAEVYQG
jgi:predicted amidohydrolase YtcJ